MFMSLILEATCLVLNVWAWLDCPEWGYQESYYALSMFDPEFWAQDWTSIMTYGSISLVAFTMFVMILAFGWVIEHEIERRFPKEA